MQNSMSVPTASLIEGTTRFACKATSLTFFRRVAFLALFCFFTMYTFGQSVTVSVGSDGTATIVYTPPAATTPPPVVVTTAPAVTIAASPTSIPAGSTTTISYTRTNATSATFAIGSVSGTVAATSNSVTVTPAATTTYTVTGTNSEGSTSKSVTDYRHSSRINRGSSVILRRHHSRRFLLSCQ
jgi:hypothetical protein